MTARFLLAWLIVSAVGLAPFAKRAMGADNPLGKTVAEVIPVGLKSSTRSTSAT